MGKKNKSKNKSNNNSISITTTKELDSVVVPNVELDEEQEQEQEQEQADSVELLEYKTTVEIAESDVTEVEVIDALVLKKEEEENVEILFESVSLDKELVPAQDVVEQEGIEGMMESIDLSSIPIDLLSPIVEPQELIVVEEKIDDDDSLKVETIEEELDIIEETTSSTSIPISSVPESEINTISTSSPTAAINLPSPSTLPSATTLESIPIENSTESLPTTNNSSITNLSTFNSTSNSTEDENISTPPSPRSVKFALPTTSESILPSSSSTSTTTPPNGLEKGMETPPSPTLEIPKQPTPRRGSTIRQLMVSMTRQRDLPPKSKEEEKRHLKELESMQAFSKASDLRRKSQFDLLASQKASSLAVAASTWESYILPNWRSVLRDDPEGKSLRDLWWKGTMPGQMRGRIWGMCIGNGLAVNRGSYTSLLTKAKGMIEKGEYPKEVRERMMKDVEGTLGEVKLFQEGGAMHEDLVDLLLAYSVYEKEVPEYPKGISYAAGMILLNMSSSDAFLALINLVNKSILKSFYSENLEEVDAYYRIFDTLLADNMPFVYANFTKESVKPSLYLYPWLTTLFVHYLPLDLSIRLFDNFLLEGDSFLFRVALALLQILEPRLFNPQLNELEAIFKGTDRGAVVIVRREKTRGTGGEAGREQEEVEVRTDEVYREMGVGEESLFGRLERLDWKEETWDRLVARELPEND